MISSRRTTKMFSNNSRQAMTNITESHSSCDQFLEETFIILDSVTGAVILLGNALVFASIATSSRLRQQNMNLFLASLAITDIIMGACVAPGYAIFCMGCLEYTLSKYCWFLEGPKDVAFASSIYNLLAISYDRYLAVYRPLQYKDVMTRRRCVSILSVVWILSFAIALIRNFWVHTKTGAELSAISGLYNNILMVVVLLIPCIIISVINIKIIITIRKQERQVFALRNPQDASEADSPDETRAEVSRKRKGTIACALVVIVFVVSWIPRISFNIQYAIRGDLSQIDTLLQKVSIFFFLVQSAVNPLIYSFYRADFRQAAIKLLRCTAGGTAETE